MGQKRAMTSQTHILLFDGFADVYTASCVSELREKGKAVSLVGLTSKMVRSAAGVEIKPDLSLSQINGNPKVLIVPPAAGKECIAFQLEPRLHTLFKGVHNQGGEIVASLNLMKAFQAVIRNE